jgi:hypothetical protein
MFAFHEVPINGRARILKEARQLLKRGGTLTAVDICPTHQPSPCMLAGQDVLLNAAPLLIILIILTVLAFYFREPCLKEYQQNINQQLETILGFTSWTHTRVVPGHVKLSLLAACQGLDNNLCSLLRPSLECWLHLEAK